MNNELEWKTGKPEREGPCVVVEFIEHNGLKLRKVGFAVYSHVGKRKPFFWRKNYKTHKRTNLNETVKYHICLPVLPSDYESKKE